MLNRITKSLFSPRYFASSILITILFAPILFSACADKPSSVNTFTLDFSVLEYPEYEEYNQRYVDGLMQVRASQLKLQESTDLYCSTDKLHYTIGEEVIVTIENKSKWPVYLFENDIEAKKIADTTNTNGQRKKFNSELVSSSPAIRGRITDENLACLELYVSGIHKLVASKFGMTGFEKPLESGQKFQFKVKMPRRSGRYGFTFNCFTRNGSIVPMFFTLSNAFQID